MKNCVLHAADLCTDDVPWLDGAGCSSPALISRRKHPGKLFVALFVVDPFYLDLRDRRLSALNRTNDVVSGFWNMAAILLAWGDFEHPVDHVWSCLSDHSRNHGISNDCGAGSCSEFLDR